MRLIQFEQRDSEVLLIQFAGDGRTMVAGLGQGELVKKLCWWDLRTDRQIRVEPGHEFPYQPPEWPRPVFSGDLTRWAVWGDRGHSAVVVADRRGKERRAAWLSRREYNESPVKALALSPDGQSIFASILTRGPGDYETCYLQHWEVEPALNPRKGNDSGERVHLTPGTQQFVDDNVSCSPELVRCLAVAPKRNLIAGGTCHGRVVVWSHPDLDELMEFVIPFRNNQDVRDFGPPRNSANRLAFSSDGNQLTAVTSAGLAAWDLETDERLFAVDHLGPVLDVGYAPNGREVATACQASGVMVLDTAGAVRHRFAWPIGSVRSVAFAPDGLTAAAGGEHGQIVLWDLDH